MTSDGLTRHVRDEEILQIVTGAADLNQACNALSSSKKTAVETTTSPACWSGSWNDRGIRTSSASCFRRPQWQNSI